MKVITDVKVIDVPEDCWNYDTYHWESGSGELVSVREMITLKGKRITRYHVEPETGEVLIDYDTVVCATPEVEELLQFSYQDFDNLKSERDSYERIFNKMLNRVTKYETAGWLQRLKYLFTGRME